jgi:hypothetical protein
VQEKGRGGDPSGFYRAAIEDLDRALGIDRGDAASWRARGNAQYSWAAWRAERGEPARELWKGALESFEEASGRSAALGREVAPLMERCRRELEGK